MPYTTLNTPEERRERRRNEELVTRLEWTEMFYQRLKLQHESLKRTFEHCLDMLSAAEDEIAKLKEGEVEDES